MREEEFNDILQRLWDFGIDMKKIRVIHENDWTSGKTVYQSNFGPVEIVRTTDA